MYKVFKSLLFQLDAEKAHHLTTFVFVSVLKIPGLRQILRIAFKKEDPKLEKKIWGLTFKNPVGLAAGFDKNGEYIEAMSLLGFGFIEVGTVTPRPQEGNPKPRLFRLPQDEALINRMGFNNKGGDYLVERLSKLEKKDIIIGGNIGKNKNTPLEKAHEDYSICFEKLYPYVDYFVVNVSSPNTPGLRSLQERGPLEKILNALLVYRSTQTIKKPILLKIAPDLNQYQLAEIMDILKEMKIEGIISANTTIDRSALRTSAATVEGIGAGGLSGFPVQKRSYELLKEIKLHSNEIKIIGVGGINSPESAVDKLEIGADLIQVYSGLVYEGPNLIKRIKEKLISLS